jgi:predicted component of type VI protein secretion system
MDVKVDIRDKDGQALASTPRTEPVAQTTVYDGSLAQAEQRIQHIIAGDKLPALTQLADLPAPAAPAQPPAQPAIRRGISHDFHDFCQPGAGASPPPPAARPMPPPSPRSRARSSPWARWRCRWPPS